MKGISVITTTLNCERHMRTFLNALQWVDKVIITDAGSTDKTLDIAKDYDNTEIYVIEGCGFSEGLENSIALSETEWILMLGSDEEVTLELAKEIQEVIAHDNGKYNGFKIPSKIYVLGKYIPDHPCNSPNVRLARRSASHFLPRRIHERLIVDGPVGMLKHYYWHYHDEQITGHIKKINRYTDFEVLERIDRGEFFELKNIFTKPLRYFFWQYFMLKKYQQGIRGLYLAVMKGFYKFLEEMKMYEWEVLQSKR